MLESVDVNSPTSEVLAQRAQSGNHRALDELLSRHKQEAYRVALRITCNPDDAEEVLQNSLERVVRHLRKYDPSRRFRPWFLKIVTNQSRTFLRRLALKRFWVSQELDEDAAPAEGGPEADAERSMMRRQLELALAELPPGQREIFVLKHIEELSFEEVSEITGQSVNNLKVKAHRARRSLLRILSKRGVTLRAACG